MPKINSIHAHEILDSRGNPTVHASVMLKNGIIGSAAAPSGASTGIHEALELRDGDPDRYFGKGVCKACKNVNTKIAHKLKNMSIYNQREIDQVMLKLDGTKNKKRLGANAILAVSLACAHAGARSKGMPLYKYLRWAYDIRQDQYKMPTPLMNIFNGGKHADTNLDIQEFKIIPTGIKGFRRQVQAGSEIFHALGDVLHAADLDTDVGNEGGYAPNIGKTEQAFEYILKAIKKAKYTAGKQIKLGLDVAASEIFNPKKKRYVLRTDRRNLTADQLIDLYEEWQAKYPLYSIEDGLDQDAWDGWYELTKRMKKKTVIIGDDLFVTDIDRLARGVEERVANAILIKPNQIGSLTETIDTILFAQMHKYKVIISHRSGETCDTTIADIAVAVNAEFVKIGSLSRSERLAKYNRLMEIEEEVSR